MATDYQSLVIGNSPVAYFPMNDSSGDIVDLVGGLVMEAQDGPLAYHQDTEMGLGYSIRFDTTGSFKSLDETLRLNSTEWSLEVWLATYSGSVQGNILCRDQSYRLYVDSGTMHLEINDTVNGDHDVTFDYSGYEDVAIHHVVVVVTADAVEFWVDGVLEQTTSGTYEADWDIAEATYIGDSSFFPDPANAYIDDTAFYDSALVEADIVAHYEQGILAAFNSDETDLTVRTVLDIGVMERVLAYMNVGTAFTVTSVETGIKRVNPWWDHHYMYRRVLDLVATKDGVPANHPMSVEIMKDTVRRGKIRDDYADIEVAYLKTKLPAVWVRVNKYVEELDDRFIVHFPLVEALSPDEVSDKYFVYYGNPNLRGLLVENPYTVNDWPLFVDYDSPKVDYTRPGEDWVEGVSDTYLARASFPFYGDKFQVHASKGPSAGIMEVSINGGTWTDVDLYNVAQQSPAVVYEQTDISVSGRNFVRIRVSGRKNPAASSTEINLSGIAYAQYSEFINVQEEADSTRRWSSSIGGSV